jgi:hypothetical protein
MATPKLPPAKQMFADCFDANGEVKSAKQLVQRRQEFIEAMNKSTYDGLTGRTWIESQTEDGTPLVKSRDTAATELHDSAVRSGFAKAANSFNYSPPSGGYGQLIKEWTSNFGVAA